MKEAVNSMGISPEIWRNHEEQVCVPGNCNQPNLRAEDGVMKVKQIYEKAGKEQEKVNVRQCGYRFNHPRKPDFSDAMWKECMDSCSVMRTVSHPQVSMRTLLYQCRQHRTGKTYSKVQEPE
jgi:hypothetical protein